MIRGLDPGKYEPIPIGITKEGDSGALVRARKQMLPKEIVRGGQPVAMTADPTDVSLIKLGSNGSHSGAASQKQDVAFPVMHGTYGEDGTICGLLDLC